MSLGENVRELRTARGWTQLQLANAAGVHVKYISSIEREARNAGRMLVKKLCAALDVDERTLRFGPQLPESQPALQFLFEQIEKVYTDMSPAGKQSLRLRLLDIVMAERTGKPA